MTRESRTATPFGMADWKADAEPSTMATRPARSENFMVAVRRWSFRSYYRGGLYAVGGMN